MNQKISQEYGDQFRQELAKQKAILDKQIEEAARKIEEADKQASEAILSASARAEEAEQRACVRAKEAIAEASALAVESANARLEMVVAAQAEEIERRANDEGKKLPETGRQSITRRWRVLRGSR
jgi:rRNA-processing protein FCF1